MPICEVRQVILILFLFLIVFKSPLGDLGACSPSELVLKVKKGGFREGIYSIFATAPFTTNLKVETNQRRDYGFVMTYSFTPVTPESASVVS